MLCFVDVKVYLTAHPMPELGRGPGVWLRRVEAKIVLLFVVEERIGR